ncbi:hypothetical protein JRI60_27765 [Archangium violaceum]|uniref:hypothetical protein n=1 Tax=Archangium violaceum TaxID=83451 RepID=UPI00194E9DF1|nr:hypothetical protein [Archangium violaceum]QRN93004.1 hypothetical protein JRI60_27765 [Archangium violaceum]
MAQPPSGQGKGQGGSGSGQRTTTSGATPAARTSTGTGIPRTSTSGSVPAARSPTGEQPAVRRSPTLSSLPNVRAGVTAFELGSTQDSKSFKKGLDQSAFDGEGEHTQVDALLGARRQPSPPPTEESASAGKTFDGTTPPPEVISRDVWKAINAPLQSREGRRSPDLYKQVINQFAAGHNPRYEAADAKQGRSHIFVWDVTRAMNAEIPHFVGPRELTVSQTCDWLRHEGTMRGWRRADVESAAAAADEGKPVVAVPKDSSVRCIGVVRPGGLGQDGRPRFAAAGLQRGNDLGTKEAFGVMALEYFVHD